MSAATSSTLSPVYLAAIAVHDAACRHYRADIALYRRGEISDFEFAVAKRVKRAADSVFDAAYTAEERAEGVVL